MLHVLYYIGDWKGKQLAASTTTVNYLVTTENTGQSVCPISMVRGRDFPKLPIFKALTCLFISKTEGSNIGDISYPTRSGHISRIQSRTHHITEGDIWDDKV